MKPVLAFLSASCCLTLSLAGCRKEKPFAPLPFVAAALDKTTLLATVPEAAKAPESPIGSGLGMHPSNPGGELEFIFSDRGGGVAWVVEVDGKYRVVHDGHDGEPYEAVKAIALSADGRRCAYDALAGGKWRVVVDGEEGEPYSAVERPVFSPDGAHVAYRAMEGERWYLVVDGKRNAGTSARLLKHDFSADASRIVLIDDVDEATSSGKLVVADLAFGSQKVVDASATRILLNADHSRVAAVSVADGQQRVVTFAFASPERAERGPAYDAVHDLAFGADGVSLAYLAERSGKRYVVLNGREEPVAGDMVGLPASRPDGRGAGALVVANGSVRLRQFLLDAAKEEPAYEEAEGLAYGGDGSNHAYAARRGDRWFIVANGKEGPPFDRVVTPAYSPDGKFLVYRARQDGKRFVVVADARGKTVRQHPPYEQVFPIIFTADGKSVAYGVKDGRQLWWKVEPL